MTYKPAPGSNYWCCPVCRKPVRCAIAGQTPRHGWRVSSTANSGKKGSWIELAACRGSGMPAELVMAQKKAER